MSINTQKKFLYFPILNFIIIAFCFLKQCYYYNASKIWFFKKTGKIFLGLIFVAILRAVLAWAIDNVQINNAMFYIDVYLSFLIISKVSLDAQIELKSNAQK